MKSTRSNRITLRWAESKLKLWGSRITAANFYLIRIPCASYPTSNPPLSKNVVQLVSPVGKPLKKSNWKKWHYVDVSAQEAHIRIKYVYYTYNCSLCTYIEYVLYTYIIRLKVRLFYVYWSYRINVLHKRIMYVYKTYSMTMTFLFVLSQNRIENVFESTIRIITEHIINVGNEIYCS